MPLPIVRARISEGDKRIQSLTVHTDEIVEATLDREARKFASHRIFTQHQDGSLHGNVSCSFLIRPT
jgi:hypothetical protein